MIRTMGVAILIGVLFVSSLVPVCIAGETAYGSVHAWFRASDGMWENATVHPLLRRGEPFDIKIVVTTKTDLKAFFLKLHEIGTPVYEVVEGPTAMEKLFENRQTMISNQFFSYLWKIRIKADTTWVNGYAPLELFVQFNKNDTDESSVNFDVINAFIIDQPWEKDRQENITESFSSPQRHNIVVPGFTFACILIVVVFLSFILRARQQKRKLR